MLNLILLLALMVSSSCILFISYSYFIKYETIESEKEYLLNTGFLRRKIYTKYKHFLRRGKEIHPPLEVKREQKTEIDPKFALEFIPYFTFLDGGKNLFEKVANSFVK